MKEILKAFSEHKISIEEAEMALRLHHIEAVADFAKLDPHREHRKGVPEVVMAATKSPGMLLEILKKFLDRSGRVLASRVTEEQMRLVEETFSKELIQLYPSSRMLVLKKPDFQPKSSGGRVAVISAGTSDIPAAEEAAVVAREMSCTVYTHYDVGVAGLHRIIEPVRSMVQEKVDVAIVAAGMEGALPSVIAGLVEIPVIGLPTSVGYGIGGKGEAALYAMLQSCAPGLVVVNIDNGVGAGATAGIIANRSKK